MNATERHISGGVRTTLALLCAAVLLPVAAIADSLDSLSSLSQERFNSFSRNLGAATHYKSLSPAEGLGILGFDIGVNLSSTDIDQSLFDLASSGSFDGAELILPRVHLQKGLPFGLDVGASFSNVPQTDISVLGGELRLSIVDGGIVTPAVALRASYSQVEGIENLAFNSSALELTISKGFLLLTPYAGVGLVRTRAEPDNLGTLRAETFDQEKIYAGVVLNFGFALTLEADRTGDFRTYSAKTGIRF